MRSTISSQSARSEPPREGKVQDVSLTEAITLICQKNITADDRNCAARLLLDWTGVATAGSMTKQGTAVRDTVENRSQNSICHAIALGRASAEQAAFVNGAYGTLLEMDDLHRGSILHAGDVVIPAALAFAQQTDCDGEHLLNSLVVGFEVALRIGMAAAQGGYSAWYNSGTCGIFGAAMAAAHAANLSYEEKCDALGHAGMQASGLWQCRLEPTDSKCLATAHAARAGVSAARFATVGLRGARQILEGDLGFFPTLYPNADANAVCEERDNWMIHEVSFKPWPACRHVHPAIDAALNLCTKLDVSTVDRVTVQTYAAGIAFCDRPCPKTPHEARFSFQHAIAIALLRGAPKLSDFTDDAINDPKVVRLRDKINLLEAADLTKAFPDQMGAVVDISTKHGQRLIHESEHALGDPEMPMSLAAIHEKFHANMDASGVHHHIAGNLLKSIFDLKDASSLRNFDQCLEAITNTIGTRTSKDFIK